jgi:two-component system sensor histidine kinase HydH
MLNCIILYSMRLMREQSLFTIALGFLFLVMIGFVVFSLMMLIGDKLSLMKRSIRMVANQIITYATLEKDFNFHDLEPDIVGVGIYDACGQVLTHSGSAPLSFLPEQKESTVINENRQTVTVVLTKDNPGKATDPHHIFIEVAIHEHLQRIALMQSVSLISPFFLTVIMLIFIYLYKRNLNYRKKIAVQEQLIHIGGAARTLSHEIKNPLSAIRLQAAYLKRVLPKKSHKSIEVIEEETERLSHLSRRISDFLKDPIGFKEKINLYKFVKELATKFNYPFNIIPVKAEAIYIQADKERLRSIFENIFQNAVESMLPEQEKQNSDQDALKPIEVHMNQEHSKLTIDVYDSGTGIAKQKKEQLFDPFFTTKSKGTGLGLFIAHRFIKALEGKILLVSPKTGGTKVTVIFPLRKKA